MYDNPIKFDHLTNVTVHLRWPILILSSCLKPAVFQALHFTMLQGSQWGETYLIADSNCDLQTKWPDYCHTSWGMFFHFQLFPHFIKTTQRTYENVSINTLSKRQKWEWQLELPTSGGRVRRKNWLITISESDKITTSNHLGTKILDENHRIT